MKKNSTAENKYLNFGYSYDIYKKALIVLLQSCFINLVDLIYIDPRRTKAEHSTKLSFHNSRRSTDFYSTWVLLKFPVPSP